MKIVAIENEESTSSTGPLVQNAVDCQDTRSFSRGTASTRGSAAPGIFGKGERCDWIQRPAGHSDNGPLARRLRLLVVLRRQPLNRVLTELLDKDLPSLTELTEQLNRQGSDEN